MFVIGPKLTRKNQTRTHDVWYPKQKRLNNGAPIPNPHPAPASTPDEPTSSSNSRTYTVSRWKEMSTTSTSWTKSERKWGAKGESGGLSKPSKELTGIIFYWSETVVSHWRRHWRSLLWVMRSRWRGWLGKGYLLCWGLRFGSLSPVRRRRSLLFRRVITVIYLTKAVDGMVTPATQQIDHVSLVSSKVWSFEYKCRCSSFSFNVLSYLQYACFTR